MTGAISESFAAAVVPTGATSEDGLWEQVVKDTVKRLSNDQREWLLQPENQQPYTAVQLLDQVTKEHTNMNSKLLQKFFSRIDPILNHIGSFHKAVSVIVASNPTGAGVIWGVFHLLIEVKPRYHLRNNLLI